MWFASQNNEEWASYRCLDILDYDGVVESHVECLLHKRISAHYAEIEKINGREQKVLSGIKDTWKKRQINNSQLPLIVVARSRYIAWFLHESWGLADQGSPQIGLLGAGVVGTRSWGEVVR